MKNIFAVYIGKQKRECADGFVFLKKTLSEDEMRALDEQAEALRKLEKALLFPSWAHSLSGIFFCIAIGYLGRSIAFEWKALLLFVINAFVGMFFLGLGYLICSKRKRKYNKQYEEQEQKLDHMIKVASRTLGVREPVADIDVLSFPYKRLKKDGRPKNAAFCYTALKNKMYLADRMLYIASDTELFAIPLDSIMRMYARYEIIRFTCGRSIEREDCKRYDMKKSGELYRCKWYAVLDVLFEGESFELFIPPYAVRAFQDLTGIPFDTGR